MNKYKSLVLAALMTPALCLAHGESPKPQVIPLDDMLDSIGWNWDDPVTTEVLAEGFYVLFGVGGNVLVSSGEDGVLIVDDQFPQMVPKLKKAMRKQGDRSIDFVINTHWHFDHADGNLALGKDDTWLVSQSNSREMMTRDQLVNLGGAAIEQKAYPAHALPHITFDDRMQFHINGELVDLLHFGPAHTTGDAAVIFRGRNAVHLGDVFNNSGYPFIDADNGGGIDGVIAFCEAVLGEIDDDTMVVPGHGPVTDYTTLQNYVHMLKTIRGEMVAMIKQGKTLYDIHAAGITATWDEQMGDPTLLLDRAYVSLTRRYLP